MMFFANEKLQTIEVDHKVIKGIVQLSVNDNTSLVLLKDGSRIVVKGWWAGLAENVAYLTKRDEDQAA